MLIIWQLSRVLTIATDEAVSFIHQHYGMMQNDSPRFLQGYNICVCIVSFVVCNLGSLDKIWCGGVGQWDQRVSEMLGGRTRTVHFMRGWVAQETSCWRKIAWHTLYGAHVEWDVRYKWIIDNVFPPPSQKACVHSSERWNLKMEKMELLFVYVWKGRIIFRNQQILGGVWALYVSP